MIEITLPAWMRLCLWATAAMNLLGSLTLLPDVLLGPAELGLPPTEHPLYLWILAEFIFLFGLAYGYCAWRAQASPLFIGLGAAGKLVFFSTLFCFWLAGDLPGLVVLMASGDLIFGGLFLIWLTQKAQHQRQT